MTSGFRLAPPSRTKMETVTTSFSRHCRSTERSSFASQRATSRSAKQDRASSEGPTGRPRGAARKIRLSPPAVALEQRAGSEPPAQTRRLSIWRQQGRTLLPLLYFPQTSAARRGLRIVGARLCDGGRYGREAPRAETRQ